MLKLPGFGLQRFRSFDEHMQFVAPLGKVTLIAGQNNASKSNIMRFAHIVLGPAHGKSGVECGAPVSPTSMPPDATELLAAACAARSDLHEHSRHLTRDALEAVAKSPSCPARWGRQWVSGHLRTPSGARRSETIRFRRPRGDHFRRDSILQQPPGGTVDATMATRSATPASPSVLMALRTETANPLPTRTGTTA